MCWRSHRTKGYGSMALLHILASAKRAMPARCITLERRHHCVMSCMHYSYTYYVFVRCQVWFVLTGRRVQWTDSLIWRTCCTTKHLFHSTQMPIAFIFPFSIYSIFVECATVCRSLAAGVCTTILLSVCLHSTRSNINFPKMQTNVLKKKRSGGKKWAKRKAKKCSRAQTHKANSAHTRHTIYNCINYRNAMPMRQFAQCMAVAHVSFWNWIILNDSAPFPSHVVVVALIPLSAAVAPESIRSHPARLCRKIRSSMLSNQFISERCATRSTFSSLTCGNSIISFLNKHFATFPRASGDTVDVRHVNTSA